VHKVLLEILVRQVQALLVRLVQPVLLDLQDPLVLLDLKELLELLEV
jgi:hypothetical protein